MKDVKVQCIRGMRDILPDVIGAWRHLEETAADCFHQYGYREIRTPIVERLELFARQLGEESDIVQKEMYAFTDALNGDKVALRPEATVSTVRALLAGGYQRGGIVRVWYGGPMFRHERPQKGRYRQFHQLGGEILGEVDPAMESEQIIMLSRLWRTLGIADRLVLDINNLGNSEERRRHRQKLIEYFDCYRNDLDEASQSRIHSNPLRVLDSKDPQTAAIAATAPRLADELGDESYRHVDAVKTQLTAAGVKFNQRDSLVRGLDYYNLTVFEWSAADDKRRQNAVGGGGRYDGLAEKISGAVMPGCGFALGVERLLALLPDRAPPPPNCYIAVTDDDGARLADRVAETCRDDGLMVWRHIGGGKLAKQIKKADQLGAQLVIIIGADENAGDYVTVKRLTDGKQETTAAKNAVQQVRKLINHGG